MKSVKSKGNAQTVNKSIRLIVIFLILGISFIAYKQVGWAKGSSGPLLSAREEGQSVVAAKKDECKDNNKNKDKCGTVKPPPKKLLIPLTGDYSVGGFCTLNITLNDPAYAIDASVKTPLPLALPQKVHKVEQGCLLTVSNAGQRVAVLSPTAGSATICFAATPNKQMVIYFYDDSLPFSTWTPLGTSLQNGMACAAADQSGLYVATYMNP